MEVDEPTQNFKRPLTRTNAGVFFRTSSQGFLPDLESDSAVSLRERSVPGTMGTLSENEHAESSAAPATTDSCHAAPRPSSILLNRDGSRRRSRNRKPSSLLFSDEVEGGESKRQSPSPSKTRRMTEFDPYQVFQVQHRNPTVLTVVVLRGENITNGWQDYLDTPDPYIKLRVPNAPEARKRTTTIDNNCNPVWNETFTFYLDITHSRTLELTLMEANYLNMDQTLGTEVYNLADLTNEEWKEDVVHFNNGANGSVHVKLLLQDDQHPTLRYSLCLCDEEKAFREKRKAKTLEAMHDLLGDKGPNDTSDLPTVGVIGSGGGFRAMTAYSGVFNALYKSKILDCVTYAAGLSGSSWYLSTLYSHPEWPHISPEDVQTELKQNIEHSILYLLKLPSVYRYLDRILQKRRQGQPVSFTDFFGHMVGETLLKGRLDSKLTDQRERIDKGEVPMPLYTCVHVKKDVPAKSFQEWVEFSPYEIGLPKYGTFMDSKLFGSKFFMGRLVKQFSEQPLHFLQGIWGSAFCILLRRMMEDNSRVDPVEMIRQELEKEVDEAKHDGEESDLSDEETDENSEESDSKGSGSDEPSSASRSASAKPRKSGGKPVSRKPSVHRTNKKSFWSDLLTKVFESQNISLLNTRAGRAAVIHNFMRGLSLTQSYPISPFTPYHERVKEGDAFDGNFEMHPTDVKQIYMVDAGLTFNSPYPLMLRGQRSVDIILSFDFSARPTDDTPPFKELILAEKWARINKIPFPPIDTDVVKREGLKELYIFRHPTDPHCPIVLHFPLVNINFRHFKAPGVPRETQEEKDFANFDIFDDPNTPYSTFNFKYSNQQFDRLAQLTEFNTLLHIEDIKQVMAEVVELRRQHGPRLPIASKNIKLLRIKSIKERRRLKRYLNRMESNKTPGEAHPITPTTPFFPAVQQLSPELEAAPQGFKVPQDVEGVQGEELEQSEDAGVQMRPKFRRQSTITTVSDVTRSLSLKSPTLQDSVESQDSGTESWPPASARQSDEDDDDDDDDVDEDDEETFYDAEDNHLPFSEVTRL